MGYLRSCIKTLCGYQAYGIENKKKGIGRGIGRGIGKGRGSEGRSLTGENNKIVCAEGRRPFKLDLSPSRGQLARNAHKKKGARKGERNKKSGEREREKQNKTMLPKTKNRNRN